MREPTSLPADGSARLFHIGVKPLAPDDWIATDSALPDYLAEKALLFSERPEEVFRAEPGTEVAQAEVLTLLADHLVRRFPDTYRRLGDGIEIVPLHHHVPLVQPGTAPLQVAAGLVQEDLLLMRKSETGWRLVAGALCFPSSWSLAEKFGQPIHAIHAPVPGFGGESRNAQLIARMFDNARPETPMLRWNWSLYGNDRLFHPDPAPPRRFGPRSRPDSIFLRVERQTLRCLPQSGDILFTVRIIIDPLDEIARQADGVGIASMLRDQLAALDPDQLAYKGMTRERDRVLERLAAIIAEKG